MTRGRAGGAATALLMMVGVLGAVVVPASPAQAAEGWPDQCVETLYGFGSHSDFYHPGVRIDDINVTLRSDKWGESDFYLAQGDVMLAQISDSMRMWSYRLDHLEITFDEEAALQHGDGGPDPSPGPVVMQPYQGMGVIHGLGQGELRVIEQSSTGQREVGATMRVTYNDCDTDRDGVPDNARDNCDGLPNQDQRDNDSDQVGDACDADDDNDAVADSGDNCPTQSNADQANFDGDSAGDACDGDDDNDGHPDSGDVCPKGYGDPCPPPPPTAPQPPAGTTPPGSTTGPTATPTMPTTTPPAVRRSVVLSVERRRVLRGAVSSAASACTTRAHVRVLRKEKGRDRVVARTRAGLSGSFKVKLDKGLRPGRYYARLRAQEVPGPVACSADRSEVVRVRRR